MSESQDPKALSRERYSRFAEGYVSSETHARGSDLDRLLAIVQPEPHWQALDIATAADTRRSNSRPCRPCNRK